MQTRTIKLPDNFINLLTNLPETGMGYQIVNVILKGGTILRKHKVLNSTLLLLEENEDFSGFDIERIEPENKK